MTNRSVRSSQLTRRIVYSMISCFALASARETSRSCDDECLGRSGEIAIAEFSRLTCSPFLPSNMNHI